MCIRPLFLPKTGIDVPCGKCFECVKRRRNDWYIRCLIESGHRRYTYFGLLTYKEVGQNLLKRDIQLFLKRLRIKGYSFSYLIAGEYGEKKKRAHWHCLFFADTPISFAHIANAWRGGYSYSTPNVGGWIRFEPIKSPRSIRYTVKYLYKYDGTSNKFELMISKNPAIGKSFLVNQAHFLRVQNADFTVRGQKTAMPRYYKRKIFNDYPDIKQKVNDALAAKVAAKWSEELKQYRILFPNLTESELLQTIDYNKLQYNEQFRKLENGL